MVKYTGEAKLANNNLVELSEECQLAVNGGCTFCPINNWVELLIEVFRAYN